MIPRIIILVEGGNIQAAYSDYAVDINVLDYDNFEQEDEGSIMHDHYAELKEELTTSVSNGTMQETDI